MGKRVSEELLAFIPDSEAYIPFAVIGIFIVLAATFTSVYLLKMDSEVAETIYTTKKTDPKQTAVSLAASDLTRCLNYAGIEALEWQGEHPVIQPEGKPVEKFSKDSFVLGLKNQNLEKGDTLQISIDLPSDVWGRIESLWKERNVILVVKDGSGKQIKNVNYGMATGFLKRASLRENVRIPESATPGYASVELYYGDDLKASEWFMIDNNPIKDITANSFNKLLSANYQGNTHTFMQYAVNVEPILKPEQIKIRKVEGTLQREISPTDKNYTIYYIFEIPSLDYTLVNLESGEKFDSRLKLSTLITSREPLLEELVREYELSLENSSGLDSTSNLVLGATNLRTFIYGPWQHYANGPLNILTNPALASSINGATLYTQKRVFDSVDPLALTYTTYYNGKVIYDDVSSTTDVKVGSETQSFGPSSNSKNSTSYEKQKGVNLTTTYDALAQNKSFSLDVEEGVEKSLEDSNTSLEELSEYSKINVSASDYTDGVLDGWVFNDHIWDKSTPDLVHTVAASVYKAPVQGQVLRTGFNSLRSLNSKVTANFDSSSVSFNGHTVNWNSKYNVSGTHRGSLVPSYSWSDKVSSSYSYSLNPSIRPKRGNLVQWSLTGGSVSSLSTDISNIEIEHAPSHAGNDRTTFLDRSNGYLNREDHVFDWAIRYDISYKIKTRWKINYNYEYAYKWKSREKLPDGNYTTVTNYNTSSGSGSEILSETDSETLSHFETESENLTIIYHKRSPAGVYSGLSTYREPAAREYRETRVYLNDMSNDETDKEEYKSENGTENLKENISENTTENITEKLDPCCSDAADKYRQQFVDLREIEGTYWAYPDRQYLPLYSVTCDVPVWLHKIMAEEVLLMLEAVEEDNPSFDYSLVESPGQDPTDLQLKTSRKLIRKLESNREKYVNKAQYLTSKGRIYTSSDSARYIVKNEVYNKLLQDIEEKNSELDSNLNSYILETLKNKGLDTSALDSVSSGSMTLFNNPAIEMASSVLEKDMGIISTMTVTGQPESKYNWTENLTLIVDQKPNYLYHDPDFDLREEYEWVDAMSGKTIYPLGVRNTCIFTTGISEDIANALASNNEYVKTETSQQISRSILNLNNEVSQLDQNLSEQGVSLDTTYLDRQIYVLNNVYAQEMKDQITENIVAEVSSNPVISGWISKEHLRVITRVYLVSLPSEQIIKKSSTDELASELSVLIKNEIRNLNPKVDPDELEATLNRIDSDVRIGVSNGICATMQNKGAALDACFGKIDSELRKLEDKNIAIYSGNTVAKISKRLDKTMAAIPCGLPVLPPHWVFTINVWTYEVIGRYQVFTVIDNDNEAIPKPYFGHKGQKYVRKDERIKHPFKQKDDGSPIIIGDNTPINFQLNGYSATVVGTGLKGVGDKSGDHMEKSIGYDNLKLELE